MRLKKKKTTEASPVLMKALSSLAPVKPESEFVQPPFSAGALFARELLQEQLNEAIEAMETQLRESGLPRDVHTVMHSMCNIYTGVLINFDTKLMPRLRAKELEEQKKSNPNPGVPNGSAP